MQCPKCQFDNREEAIFCRKCGGSFDIELSCPNCQASNPKDSNFCEKCGCKLEIPSETLVNITESESPFFKYTDDTQAHHYPTIDGERKHVTVLFSDITGYTAMSEKLDPEDLKEITSRIFCEISNIVAKYDGFIEKYAGDAVMAMFGAPKSHEDDPVRAVKAAVEIHEMVDRVSPDIESKIEQPVSMHTGINTGLVVTGDVDMKRGTHGVAGDTINIAARLSGLGNSNDILVSQSTFIQSEGYFDFKDLGNSQIKGKSGTIRVYKVLASKDKPVKIHRLHGLRSELIGRKVEIDLLTEAFTKLQDGTGTILSICGTAGTGKSRLVEEFKSTVDLDEVQWLEGHAYPFTQNMPYYPLINLLNRSLQIEETDPPELVREKIDTGLSNLLGKNSNFIKIIGGLYSLSFPEIDDLDPEYWKPQLQKAVQLILSALSKRRPIIVCIEDLHWADPSFLELIRLLLSDSRDPILFLCIYRPIISLLSSHQIKPLANAYKEIRLQDLSPSESLIMMESLLKTNKIPIELKQFVHEKVEGNPFYVEEMINSLIESETLVKKNKTWVVEQSITESEISSTIHGLIAGRLDRLEKEAKQIIQEASVIGRSFLYEILKRITQLQDHVDKSLNGFERLDLIRTQSIEPELEYVFKHALTQEVVYNGLLKKERQKIHERIGLVIEKLFYDRLPEFYEMLSFHFSQARSHQKAVEYLIKSGEKSLKRYAIEESHQYFQEAFNLLSGKNNPSEIDKELIIDILVKWAYVFYYKGDFNYFVELYSKNEPIAKTLCNKSKQGFFIAWYGMALWIKEEYKKSESYLRNALELGKEVGDQKLIGYSCCWLSLTCTDLGLINEALELAEKGYEIAKLLHGDDYLFFKSLNAKAQAFYYRGFCTQNYEIGRLQLDYGDKKSNIRCKVVGHVSLSWAHSTAGNFDQAIESLKQAILIAEDPFYHTFPKVLLAFGYIQVGNFKEAEKLSTEVLGFSREYGCEMQATLATAILALVEFATGNMSSGMKRMKEVANRFIEKEKKGLLPLLEYILGRVYFQISTGEGKISVTSIAKNAGFLLKTKPIASNRAERHFNRAIELASEIGASGIMGQAYLDLGLLHKAKKRRDLANKCITKAVNLFEKCEAETFLKQANEALESLN